MDRNDQPNGGSRNTGVLRPLPEGPLSEAASCGRYLLFSVARDVLYECCARLLSNELLASSSPPPSDPEELSLLMERANAAAARVCRVWIENLLSLGRRDMANAVEEVGIEAGRQDPLGFLAFGGGPREREGSEKRDEAMDLDTRIDQTECTVEYGRPPLRIRVPDQYTNPLAAVTRLTGQLDSLASTGGAGHGQWYGEWSVLDATVQKMQERDFERCIAARIDGGKSDPHVGFVSASSGPSRSGNAPQQLYVGTAQALWIDKKLKRKRKRDFATENSPRRSAPHARATVEGRDPSDLLHEEWTWDGICSEMECTGESETLLDTMIHTEKFGAESGATGRTLLQGALQTIGTARMREVRRTNGNRGTDGDGDGDITLPSPKPKTVDRRYRLGVITGKSSVKGGLIAVNRFNQKTKLVTLATEEDEDELQEERERIQFDLTECALSLNWGGENRFLVFRSVEVSLED